MQYQSSKGPVAIDTMPLSYAKNALNKLRRTEPDRTAEIDALDAHVTKLTDEATEAALNPRAQIGGNEPPPEAEIKPEWEAVKIHMDDLLTEAANWADGTQIENQEQADKVGKLRQLLQDSAKLADKARVEEKKPLDDKIAEIQDRYNAYTAPLKNKKPGSVSKAVQALGSEAWNTHRQTVKTPRARKPKKSRPLPSPPVRKRKRPTTCPRWIRRTTCSLKPKKPPRP